MDFVTAVSCYGRIQQHLAGRGDRCPDASQAFVIAVEIASGEVLVTRPQAAVESAGHVLRSQLLPGGDVGDMVLERPIGPSGIGRSRAR